MPWHRVDEYLLFLDRTVATFYHPPEAQKVAEALNRAPAYAKMRAALEEARLQIEYLHSKFQETGTGNQTLARIEEALAESRE